MKALISEAAWEHAALEVLGELGWVSASGSDINDERTSASDLVLPERFEAALRKLNPGVPAPRLRQAVTDILTPTSQDPITENKRLHDLMVSGYRGVTWTDHEGTTHNPTIRLISHEPSDNDWLAVHQVRLQDREHRRRLDVVCYLNGLPVIIIELKQAGAAQADLAAAHAQLGTYLREFGMAFRACALTLISDGITAKYGTPFTPLNHYAPWNVDDDGAPLDIGQPLPDTTYDSGLEIALFGLANPERLLQLLRYYIAFDAGAGGLAKRIAKPHQYFAVAKAVGRTIEASRSDNKAGVVWHTQGSGKSMEMELYANIVARRPELRSPSVVVITDRTELNRQLFNSFAASQLLPSKPIEILGRDHLRDALTTARSGGIYFTTLQKFSLTDTERETSTNHPLLSDRHNIIVMVDEAHRSHYGLNGFAHWLRQALPHATMIAFTGTPISFIDRNTRDVFGDYIDVYDLSRAVSDGATVPVVFEPRLITVKRAADVSEEDLDRAADEAAIGLDDIERARVEQSVAVVNAIYGAPERVKALAADIVTHWEKRAQRVRPELDGPGKGLIVGATRQICADLYSAIVELRPHWHADTIDAGRIKVVYSGSATDKSPIINHVRTGTQNDTIKARLRNPDDDLELVIVKDMMLTGYDSPPLHTLYLDRPLKGALLMQTLARVNRTFRGKDTGLLVAYAPLVESLTEALAEYSPADQATRPLGRSFDEAIELARALVDQIRSLVAGYDWRAASAGPRGWVGAAQGLTNWLRAPHPSDNEPDAADTVALRFRKLSGQLGRAWALAAGAKNLGDIAAEVRFYDEVRVWMAKYDAAERSARGEPVPDEVARLLNQLVAASTEVGEVIDIYAAAQIERPNFRELTPAMLARAQASANPHLAIEALRAAILAEAASASGQSLTRQRAFSERLSAVMLRYTNAQLTAAEVLAELYALAQDISAEAKRGEAFDPPLAADELATYDAIAHNESAVDVLGQDVLADIARELVALARRDATTDWSIRDDVRAALRAKIKRLLRKHRYPPDQSEQAVKQVIEQMEVLLA